MTTILRKTLFALVGATLISTTASAGGLTAPVQEPEIDVFPVFEGPQAGSLADNNGVIVGVLGLLVLGALASGGGS